jgi:uncharacterized protein
MLELYKTLRDDFLLVDKKAKFAFVYAAIALLCIYYFRDIEWVAKLLGGTRLGDAANYIAHSKDNNLPSLTYWALLTLLFYFVIPALAIKYIFKERLSDYGLNFKFEPGSFKLYLQCGLIMLPLVYWMSMTASFADRYPFLHIYNDDPYMGTALVIWELLYFLQFFGLEFFFRGFFVHSLKPSMGVYSVLAMMVPYCMIHFGKPLAESFAAILAGIFLGWLSYRYKNIFLGLLLHCTVAFLMDTLALYHKGLLF